MSTIARILAAPDLNVAAAILKSSFAKRGISGRAKNAQRRAVNRLEQRLAAERRSEASRKAAATLRAKREAAAKEATPEPVTATRKINLSKPPLAKSKRRVAVPAN